MYRIHKSSNIINIEIDCSLSLELFPEIKKLAFFENTVPKKFLLKACNKTKEKNQAQVIVSANANYLQTKPRVLFCANKDDLIKYTLKYEDLYDICPVNVFEFEPIDFELPPFDVERVFFSSKRAFDFFIKKIGMSFLCSKKILSVGKQTADYIKSYGFSVEYPKIYRSSELDLKDTLVVCPKEHGLYDSKAIVLEVYKTLKSTDIDYYTYECDFDFALLTSPLSFEYLKSAGFEGYLKHVKKYIVCIGTTTQKAVEKFGYSCIIPQEFTIESMFKLLEELS
ncbi:MAG TPA: uroporphyrinogen-III synthase [Desulfurella acetivorans]|uniref:Uroporphyrinogen-III synthase n=1 Tax=Desulfurella acetivorans TaxID=33002 RepID=A0A7C6A7B1_DESAE|nr:uroporphyrinogen-III synthase [Desulfurella acetivorans]